MAQFNKVSDAIKKLDKAIQDSSLQAVNKALISTRAQFAKEVSQELGIPSGRVKARVLLKKATKNVAEAFLSIGVKVLFSASDFKPKAIKINTGRGARYGATIQIGSNPRTGPLSKAFIIKAKSGKKLVIERKSDSRYPTTLTLVNVFRETVEKKKEGMREYLVESFKKNFESQFKYNMDK